jgi:hypothetical protein
MLSYGSNSLTSVPTTARSYPLHYDSSGSSHKTVFVPYVERIDPLKRARAWELEQCNSAQNPLRLQGTEGAGDGTDEGAGDGTDDGPEGETLAERGRRLRLQQANSSSAAAKGGNVDSGSSQRTLGNDQSASTSTTSLPPSSLASRSSCVTYTTGGSTGSLQSICKQSESPPASPMIKLERPFAAEMTTLPHNPEHGFALSEGHLSFESILQEIGFARLLHRQSSSENDEEDHKSLGESLCLDGKRLSIMSTRERQSVIAPDAGAVDQKFHLNRESRLGLDPDAANDPPKMPGAVHSLESILSRTDPDNSIPSQHLSPSKISAVETVPIMPSSPVPKPRINPNGPDSARWHSELAGQPRNLSARARQLCHDEYNAWVRKRRFRKYKAEGLPRPRKGWIGEAQIAGLSMSSLWDDINSVLSGNTSSLSTSGDSNVRSTSVSQPPVSVPLTAQQSTSAPMKRNEASPSFNKKRRNSVEQKPRRVRLTLRRRSKAQRLALPWSRRLHGKNRK